MKDDLSDGEASLAWVGLWDISLFPRGQCPNLAISKLTMALGSSRDTVRASQIIRVCGCEGGVRCVRGPAGAEPIGPCVDATSCSRENAILPRMRPAGRECAQPLPCWVGSALDALQEIRMLPARGILCQGQDIVGHF